MNYGQKLSEILSEKSIDNAVMNNVRGDVTDDVRSGVSVEYRDNLMKVRDVSSFVGCSDRHVRRMVEQGRFPKPIKIGRLARWRREIISEWLAKNELQA